MTSTTIWWWQGYFSRPSSNGEEVAHVRPRWATTRRQVRDKLQQVDPPVRHARSNGKRLFYTPRRHVSLAQHSIRYISDDKHTRRWWCLHIPIVKSKESQTKSIVSTFHFLKKKKSERENKIHLLAVYKRAGSRWPRNRWTTHFRSGRDNSPFSL